MALFIPRTGRSLINLPGKCYIFVRSTKGQRDNCGELPGLQRHEGDKIEGQRDAIPAFIVYFASSSLL